MLSANQKLALTNQNPPPRVQTLELGSHPQGGKCFGFRADERLRRTNRVGLRLLKRLDAATQHGKTFRQDYCKFTVRVQSMASFLN